MTQETAPSFFSVLPGLLWVALAALALAIFHEPLSGLLTRSTRAKLGMLELEAQALIEKSAKKSPKELAQGSSNAQVLPLRRKWGSLPEQERPCRIYVAQDIFVEAKPIQPAFPDPEFEADIALCPDDIEKALRQHSFGAVVSDIKWNERKDLPPNKQNGVEFQSYAVQGSFARRTAFFVANYDPKTWGSAPLVWYIQ